MSRRKISTNEHNSSAKIQLNKNIFYKTICVWDSDKNSELVQLHSDGAFGKFQPYL